MTFLVCPRWRKIRPASPSDLARSYHDNTADAQENQDLDQVPYQSPNDGDFAERNEKHPGSFSNRLRRRFSRESKASSEVRDVSKLGFPFNLKSIRSIPKTGSKPGQDLKTLGNLGSSLMSERAYDSDAQFITTPRNTGSLLRSPSAKRFRRIALSDLTEQSSHEREATEHRWAPGQLRNASLSHQSTSDAQFISTPTASLPSTRDQICTPQLAHQAPSHQSSSQRSSPFQGPPFLGEYDLNIKSARSLPDLTVAGPRSIPSFAPTPATIAIPRSFVNSRSLADWKQYLDASHRNYSPVHSGALPYPSEDILVKKNRQLSASVRSFTDPRSIHLDELGISHRLASQTTVSGTLSCKPSMPRLIHPNKDGFFVSPSQENIQPVQESRTVLSGADSLNQTPGKRDFSSFYSPQSGSIASNRSRLNSQRSVNDLTTNEPYINEQTSYDSGAPQRGNIQENGVFQSKFKEHCDINHSESVKPHIAPNCQEETCPTRKVSVGWMSGGRRVGYGYTPVPNEDEVTHIQEETYLPYRKPVEAKTVETKLVVLDTEATDEIKPQDLSKEQYKCVEEFLELTPEPSPSMTGNLSDMHSTNLSSVPKTREPRSMGERSTPPYLRAMLGSCTNRTNGSSSAQIDERGFKSLRAPELPPMTQIEHCQVPKSTKYSNQGNQSSPQRWSRFSPSPKRGVIASGDNAVDGSPEYFEGDDQNYIQEPCSLQPSKSRSEKWTRRFTRRKESRRVSNNQQQDSSQTSSDLYEDCESVSLAPATVAEDLASMYQECVEMPGSFDGSRWATRRSRMLWDACTEGLWHSA